MKILIACEMSGTVRDAFRAKGLDAWSCDILPNPSPWHIQGDVAMLQKMFRHDPEISQWHTPLPNGWEPPIMLADGSLVDRRHSDRRQTNG